MSAELWILGGTFVVGAMATAVSWAGAISAGRKETRAEAAQDRAEAARDKALEHSEAAVAEAKRQSDAQEVANRLLVETNELNKRYAPPAWSGPVRESGTSFHFVNTSGHTLVVHELTGQYAQGIKKLQSRTLPKLVQYGDLIQVWWRSPSLEDAPEAVLIHWYHEDESVELKQIDRRTL